MRIAIPTEVKNNEFRVAITPVGVHELVRRGHEVYIQAGAGVGSSIPDEEFVAQGAKIVSNAADTWEVGEMVIKVKEPISSEYQYLREDLTLFTYLHLAADRPQTDALLKAGTTAIAYETVQLPSGALPLLYPMSEIAGSLAPQVGAHALMKAQGGRGVLMGCIGGVPSAKVVVLGGGVAGQNAANIAMGLGADVTVLDTDLDKLRNTFWRFHNQVHGVVSSALTVQEHVLQADLVVGTVLIPGAKAPKLVTNDMVAEMKPGSCWWMSPSTRVAASRTPTRPPTTIRPSPSTTRSSTAWRTCRARCRTPPPGLSPTPPSPTRFSSPTRGRPRR